MTKQHSRQQLPPAADCGYERVMEMMPTEAPTVEMSTDAVANAAASTRVLRRQASSKGGGLGATKVASHVLILARCIVRHCDVIMMQRARRR